MSLSATAWPRWFSFKLIITFHVYKIIFKNVLISMRWEENFHFKMSQNVKNIFQTILNWYNFWWTWLILLSFQNFFWREFGWSLHSTDSTSLLFLMSSKDLNQDDYLLSQPNLRKSFRWFFRLWRIDTIYLCFNSLHNRANLKVPLKTWPLCN